MRLNARFAPTPANTPQIHLPPSKSIEARRMILQSIIGMPDFDLPKEGLPEDLTALSQALKTLDEGGDVIHTGESGTAMRLMTALTAARSRRVVQIVGTGRQHLRPIAHLVDALRLLGADIRYLGEVGYPPLEITPAKLRACPIELDASLSSQYLSALLLIAPLLREGEYRIAVSQLVSSPYARMTIEVMRSFGFYWQESPEGYSYVASSPGRIGCACGSEVDWTAASYAYLMVALRAHFGDEGMASCSLPGLRLPSAQGDSLHLPGIMEQYGVLTESTREGISLQAYRTTSDLGGPLCLSCRDYPDLVPTIVALSVALGRPLQLSGVGHLRLKESDRLMALAEAFAPIGITLDLEADSLSYDSHPPHGRLDSPIRLHTHSDHRIAMAIAPVLACLVPAGVELDRWDVVGKSFPDFWDEARALGFELE